MHPGRRFGVFGQRSAGATLETLKESGSRGAGLRVLFDKRMGASYTSDLTPEGIRRMVQSAIDLAAVTTEDPDRQAFQIPPNSARSILI